MKHHTIIPMITLLALAIAILGWGIQTASADPPRPRMASAHYALDWNAAGEISGGSGSSAHYAMNQVTISQMDADSYSTSTNYSLCTGWECIQPSISLYLPSVIK